LKAQGSRKTPALKLEVRSLSSGLIDVPGPPMLIDKDVFKCLPWRNFGGKISQMRLCKTISGICIQHLRFEQNNTPSLGIDFYFNTMATVYKSLSKANGREEETTSNGPRKNKQRVLILSSRGVTYR
jgi:hypothetical protein